MSAATTLPLGPELVVLEGGTKTEKKKKRPAPKVLRPDPITARPRSGVDRRWWWVDLAFERHVQGRGPLPHPFPPSPDGKYVPIPIDWPTLPPLLADAFGRLARALDAPGIVGAEPYLTEDGSEQVFRDAKGASVEKRLQTLDRRHKAWRQGKRTAEELRLDVLNAVALLAVAPRSPEPPEPRFRTLTLDQKREVFKIVGATWLDRTITELEETEELSTNFSQEIKQAKWRAEWNERQRRRRERVVPVTPKRDPVRRVMGKRKSTRIPEVERPRWSFGSSLFDSRK